MESSQERIGERVNKLNAYILGKPVKNTNGIMISKEGLLDAFQVLYNECETEHLKKSDGNVQVCITLNFSNKTNLIHFYFTCSCSWINTKEQFATWGDCV